MPEVSSGKQYKMAYTHQDSGSNEIDPTTLPPAPTAPDAKIISRFVDTSPWGLVFHILECLPELPQIGEPKLILLAHGFPDIAYSWRKVLPLLAQAGYHAVAYDLRGFGRTFSRQPLTEKSFRVASLVSDALALVSALGYDSVAAIVGHDFGAVTATMCSLARPDVFKALTLMSHPVKGPFTLPFATSVSQGNVLERTEKVSEDVHTKLASLVPPRKHYQRYYCTPNANDEMSNPSGAELKTFLRGYFHLKSGDWDGNTPRRLSQASAPQLAQMPYYYIMPAEMTMREAVAYDMAKVEGAEKVAEHWLNNEELGFYAEEWARTTFQGGLNWYGLTVKPDLLADAQIWTGRKISIPTIFMSGTRDWGSFQDPGALDALENEQFVEKGYYRGTIFVEGAGHWVNQEQPLACAREILKLLGGSTDNGMI